MTHVRPHEAAAHSGASALYAEDPVLSAILDREYQRQASVLSLVASSSVAAPSVLSCAGSAAMNVTAEGYPGARYHAGCRHVDEMEQLAIDRAKILFGADYANVQPHSASSANEIVMAAVLAPGDCILGMSLDAGGHLTHGARVSFSGILYRATSYGVDGEGLIDYDEVRTLAQQHRPRLIICGTTAYPRTIDFRRFRVIADEVGALLLADISHIAGLVATGLHDSPVQHAHFTTTCTHKQLYGPRGGLILMGRDHTSMVPGSQRTLAAAVQRAVFPHSQGAPILSSIAAKARTFAVAATPEFGIVTRRIVEGARALASSLISRGYKVVGNGTDNHMVIVDVDQSRKLTGLVAEQALESCDILVNKNRIAGDNRSATVCSGIRLGTNTLAARGFTAADAERCAALIDRVLSATIACGELQFSLPTEVSADVRSDVHTLCDAFPLPGYIPATEPTDAIR